jgi:hypothetical protein
MTINIQPLVVGTMFPAGPQGEPGAVGPTGQQGEQGTIGPQGATGVAGPAPYATPIPYTSGLNAVVGPPATAVINSGTVYVCTVAHTTGASINLAYWQAIPSTIAGVNSLNSLTGPLTLTSGGSAMLVSSGSNIQISDAGGFLNKFQNPHFDIASGCGTSGSVSAGTQSYTLEGWQVLTAGAACSWAQEYNQNLTGNALRLSCATGLTTCSLIARIESYFCLPWLNATKTARPITVQFTIYNATGATITPQLITYYPTSSQDTFSSTTTDLAATNLQSIANNSAGTVAYTFTPNNNCALGYQIVLAFGGALNASSGYVDISFADARSTPGLSTGLNANPPPVEYRSIEDERSYVERYFETNYPNVAPGNTSNSSVSFYSYFAMSTISQSTSGYISAYFQFRTRKRSLGSLTVTLYSPNTGATGNLYNVTSTADQTATVQNPGTVGFAVQGSVATINVQEWIVFWTANNRL